jgi:hypothetical protein
MSVVIMGVSYPRRDPRVIITCLATLTRLNIVPILKLLVLHGRFEVPLIASRELPNTQSGYHAVSCASPKFALSHS